MESLQIQGGLGKKEGGGVSKGGGGGGLMSRFTLCYFYHQYHSINFFLSWLCFGICCGQIPIKKKAKRITEKLPISDKIGKLPEAEAYIAIIEYKIKFPDNLFSHLIDSSQALVR